jgi:hypothetical protein
MLLFFLAGRLKWVAHFFSTRIRERIYEHLLYTHARLWKANGCCITGTFHVFTKGKLNNPSASEFIISGVSSPAV